MFRKFGGLAAGVARRRALTLIPATASGRTVPRDAVEACCAADLLPGTDVCRIVPDAVPAPRELDPALVRRDITEGRPGVATLVRLQVVDAACRPIANARVDVWQCDACGTYPEGGAAPETFLRGTQFSDERGVVEFATIYPGRGIGCPTRIHFAATLAMGGSATISGDILFPDTVSAYVYETVPAYCGAMAAEIASDGPPAALTAMADANEAYLAQVIVGIAPTLVSELVVHGRKTLH